MLASKSALTLSRSLYLATSVLSAAPLVTPGGGVAGGGLAGGGLGGGELGGRGLGGRGVVGAVLGQGAGEERGARAHRASRAGRG